MTIPQFHEFYPSYLKALRDGEVHINKEVEEFCANTFNISDNERELRHNCGKPILKDRLSWAKAYLKKAGLIQSINRFSVQLTEEGRKAVQEADSVDNDYLKKYPEFVKWHSKPKKTDPIEQTDPISELTPTEQIESAIKELNSALASELMEEIMKLSPEDFEKLLLKLLVAMGYGSNLKDGAKLTKRSNDEGIDGILAADKFGFDSVYIQAKQWKPDKSIGRPEIQKFGGALMGQGASKGLFITTANFSEDARLYTEKNIQTKIVLVDGNLLAKLMIEYNIGVSTVETYFIKKVDSDFFNDFE